MMSDRLYDILDWLAENLPYFTIFLGAIGEIWGIPYCSKIVLTLTALAKLLQALVKKSAVEYYKGLEDE